MRLWKENRDTEVDQNLDPTCCLVRSKIITSLPTLPAALPLRSAHRNLGQALKLDLDPTCCFARSKNTTAPHSSSLPAETPVTTNCSSGENMTLVLACAHGSPVNACTGLVNLHSQKGAGGAMPIREGFRVKGRGW